MQNYEKYPEPRLIVVSHTFVYVTNRFQRSTGCQRRPEKKKRGDSRQPSYSLHTKTT